MLNEAKERGQASQRAKQTESVKISPVAPSITPHVSTAQVVALSDAHCPDDQTAKMTPGDRRLTVKQLHVVCPSFRHIGTRVAIVFGCVREAGV